MAKQLTTINLPRELHEQARIRAIQERISMAELIRRAIESYFEKEGHDN